MDSKSEVKVDVENTDTVSSFPDNNINTGPIHQDMDTVNRKCKVGYVLSEHQL
jgi:hypothetical protein